MEFRMTTTACLQSNARTVSKVLRFGHLLLLRTRRNRTVCQTMTLSAWAGMPAGNHAHVDD